MRRFVNAVVLALTTLTMAGAVVAQVGVQAGQSAAPPPASQGGAGGPAGGQTRRPGPPAQIDLATATKAVEAAVVAATTAKALVAVAVVDANGDLVYFRRMDGATGTPVTSSQAKARAAILFGVPTKTLQDAVAAGTPVSVTVTPAAATGAAIVAVQGALPLVKGGKLIGAIGVGGSSSVNDEIFAQAGVDAVR